MSLLFIFISFFLGMVIGYAIGYNTIVTEWAKSIRREEHERSNKH